MGEWVIEAMRSGRAAHYRARNERTGQRIEADSRREIDRLIYEVDHGPGPYYGGACHVDHGGAYDLQRRSQHASAAGPVLGGLFVCDLCSCVFAATQERTGSDGTT